MERRQATNTTNTHRYCKRSSMAASPSARTCSTNEARSSRVRRRGGGGAAAAADPPADDGRWRRTMAAPTPQANRDARLSALATLAAARASSASSSRRRHDDSEPAAEVAAVAARCGRAAAACSAASRRGCGTYMVERSFRGWLLKGGPVGPAGTRAPIERRLGWAGVGARVVC